MSIGFYTYNTDAQNLDDITITITFESDTAEFTAGIAPLKYNKRFALSMQVEDGNSSIIDYGFPVFEGGVVIGTTYPGLTYTDGCGNFHSFKMTSSTYMFSGSGITGLDLHNDPVSNMITWEELHTLYDNQWGIANKGINSNDNLTTGFVEYSIARNTSYCRRKMIDAIPGKTITNMFVNPGGVKGWSLPAFGLGLLGAFNGTTPFPLSDYGGDVNDPGVNWSVDRYNLFRLNVKSINVLALVDSLSQRSVDNANYWSPIFTGSIPDDYGFSSFLNDFNFIADTYGSNGTDEILMTSDEEIIDYLLLRDAITINETLLGNALTVSFSGSVPDYLLFYDLSLVISSDVLISDISISGTDDYSISDLGTLDALVNFGWNGKFVPTNEELATTYTTIATNSQTNYDALIAMDYVSVLDYGEVKGGLVDDLCTINGVPFDNGFCESGYPNHVLITGDSIIQYGNSAQLFATEGLNSYLWSNGQVTSSITVAPTVDTKYWVESETKYGNIVSDTIVVLVTESYVINSSPLVVYHIVGVPDSLWVELKEGASPSWSTGDTENYIIVNPQESTTYALYVIVATDTVQQLNFDVILGNFLEFTYDSVCFGGTTTLWNTSVVNDSVTKVLWDLNGDTQFNDAEGDTVTYMFSSLGDHLVGMRVYFKTDPMEVVYNVVPAGDNPIVDFEYGNTCLGLTTIFYGLANVQVGVIDQWRWRFGDGKTDNFQNTSNIYTQSGSYEVMLTAWSSVGCKDSLQKTIVIFNDPVIELRTANGSIVNNLDTVFFSKGGTTTLSISDFASFDSVTWFDDSHAESITITEEGNYNVTVYRDDCDATQRFITSWGSSPQPSGKDIMNLFTPNGDGYNDIWIVNDPEISYPIKVNIYNRSGKQVYSASNYQNNWDGQYQGNPLPQATYYYVIEDSSGITFKGAVTIIR